MTDHVHAELAEREARAQHGIIEFAEEMAAIRDGNLYPGARGGGSMGEPDAWKNYCEDRWSMSKRNVDRAIAAMPVLRRLLTGHAVSREKLPGIRAAADVASLPVAVQDVILDEAASTTNYADTVREKVKAVRKEANRIRVAEEREPTDDDLITAAVSAEAKPRKKAKKRKYKLSKIDDSLITGLHALEHAADLILAQPELDEGQNDSAYAYISRCEAAIERMKDRVKRPASLKGDADEFLAELMAEREEDK